MAKKNMSPVSRMIGELKALSLACSTDGTRQSLTGLYVEYRTEDENREFHVVATDGHIMARKSYDYDTWQVLQMAIRDEWSFEIPNLPVSGIMFLTPAMRKLGQVKKLWVAAESSDDLEVEYRIYPSYRNCIPMAFENKMADMPIFAIENLVKFQKIAKGFGHEPKYFFPTGWNSPVGAAVKDYNDGLTVLLMPLRTYEERSKVN